MAKIKNVALYLRVSTDGQSTENQRRELMAAVERHGWNVVAEYKDNGISGAKGRDKRPGYDALMKAIGRKEFNMVAAWSVDRLSRSMADLITFLGEIRGKGIDLYLHTQGIDTSTPSGKAMFQLLGVFAELERGITIERINAGLARARAAGKRLGRPFVAVSKEDRIRECLQNGFGILKTARHCGVGTSVVQRIRAELQP